MSQGEKVAARNARLAISAIFLVFGLLVGTWLPYIPNAKAQIGCSEKEIGQALLCSGLGAVVSMQLMGSLIGRFGSRNLSVITACAACIVVPGLMWHHTLWGLCLNLFAAGACYGALDVAMNAHSLHVQALHEKSILSSIHGCFSIGGLIGGGLAILAVATGVTPQAHLLATGVFLFALSLFCRRYLLSSDTDKDDEGSRFVFPRGFVLLLGVLCACAFTLEGGVLDWCALYVRESLKAGPEFAGIVTGLCSGTMTVGRLFGDPVVQRLGNRNVIRYGGAICMTFLVLSVWANSVWLSIICLSLCCLGLANIVPAIFVEAGEVRGISTGSSIAAVTMCGYGGFLMGPPVVGIVADRYSMAVGMGSLSMLGLILFVGSFWVKRVKASSQSV